MKRMIDNILLAGSRYGTTISGSYKGNCSSCPAGSMLLAKH